MASVMKNCAECMDEFLPAYPSQVYCCKTCGNRAKAKVQRGKARLRLVKKCPTCGENFKLRPSNTRQQYCSKPCANRARVKDRPTRVCRYCKQKFQAQGSLEQARGKKQFCSRKCYVAHRRENMPPKLARSYADNHFSRYVRMRDGCCVYCGSTENLHCSHVLSRSISVLRCDPENAITLCARHHLYWWHKDVIGAARWFEATWPGRYDRLLKKSQDGGRVDWNVEVAKLKELMAELEDLAA